MLSRSSSADGSPRVQVPAAQADRPSWTRVGVIAAIGFVVGVAWPRLAGVRLGPSVPEIAASASPAPTAPPSGLPSAAPSAPPPAASDTPGSAPPAERPSRPPEVPVTTATPAEAPAAGPNGAGLSGSVAVGRGVVTSCKSAQGETLKGAECDAPSGLDGIIAPRLRRLSGCPAAAGESGKLRLLVRADFAHGTTSVDLAHASASAPNADALLACARAEVRGAAISALSHDNPRYTVAYTLTFAPPGDSSGAATPSVANTPAAAAVAPAPAEANGGTAQVAWEVALVRDAPKTGKVVARLQRGTQLRAGPTNDGWVPVKYGDNFASDGWVYHGAIGR